VVHPGRGGSARSFILPAILPASLPSGRLGQGRLSAQDDGGASALRLLHRDPLLLEDRTGLSRERGVQGNHGGTGSGPHHHLPVPPKVSGGAFGVACGGVVAVWAGRAGAGELSLVPELPGETGV